MIRLRKAVDDELVRRAKVAGLSVNAYIELMVVGNFVAPDAPPGWAPDLTPERKAGFVSEDFPHGFPNATCPHLRKSRQVFSWGSKCGECGARL